MLTEIHDFVLGERPAAGYRQFTHPERPPRNSDSSVVGYVIADGYPDDSIPTPVVRWGDGYEPVVDRKGFLYWFYLQRCYRTKDPDLTPEDVLALIGEKENRRRIRLEKAHALKSMVDELDYGSRRTAIPRDVKLTVWQRDKGRCVECESQKFLEFDHIIPVTMGGSNGVRNIQLLCQTCNRRKGASLG